MQGVKGSNPLSLSRNDLRPIKSGSMEDMPLTLGWTERKPWSLIRLESTSIYGESGP